MSSVPIWGPKQSPPWLLFTSSRRQKSPFQGHFTLIHCPQELSQSYPRSPLAAETTWHADEETLFVVLFGLIIHGYCAENTRSCFLNSP